MGSWGLFLTAFLDSSFLSFPELCDILMVTLSAKRPALFWIYALWTALGSVAGCSVLWWLGRRGGEAFLVRRFGEARVARTQALYDRWGILVLAVPALLPPPVPLKIFVVAAGGLGVSFVRTALTLFLARALRFGFWGFMGVKYGAQALQVIHAVAAWSRTNVWWLVVGLVAVILAAMLWRTRRQTAVEAP